MIRLLFFLSLGAVVCSCASSTTATRGATLLAGLNQYQGEMQRVGTSASRWPERQRAGASLKTIVTATVGGSAEFYRLIDLDIRKKDFLTTLRENSVRPDRAKEMIEEIAQMNDEIAALKPVIRTQLAALSLQSDPEPRVEDAATRAMISLALDSFSANGGARGSSSTTIGEFIVTDLGGFAVVRAVDGRSFQCRMFGDVENGAGMKCDETK